MGHNRKSCMHHEGFTKKGGVDVHMFLVQYVTQC